MELKETLLMPKTDFPMKGSLPTREPQVQEKWAELDIYKMVQEKTADKPLFVLHDGPPYANGDIHIGHAMNKVIKDFIVRYKSMSGFCAPYVPGWDTHGLPIEQALTKKGVKRKEMTVAEFRKLCTEFALGQVDHQRVQFKRIGVRGDWENPYITLQPEYEAEQIKVFGEMAKKGYIYKGLKPVNWSPSSESALAEAEIEYHEKTSPSIFVAFDVVDGKGVLENDTSFIIWTTTPWTLPANLGIALHAEVDYVVVKVVDRKYVVAKELLASVTEKLGWENVSVEKTVKGSELEFVEARHPFYDRKSLIMNSDHVTIEAGTGCVHTAPGHGEDDFNVGQKYNLDVLCPVDDKGVMTKEAPGFEGLFYEDANKAITQKLTETGHLLKLEFIKHQYPHDWRTKKPTIFRATAQWFASIKDFREDLLTAIQETKWIPAWGESRLYNMVRDRGDWCISRQRVWGVPIPVFYGEDGTAIINDETISHVSELFRNHGSNIWFEREAKELLPAGFTHPSSPNGIFTKEKDIMDVWFDSGSSHQAVCAARPDLHYPADLYFEGSDQYRGWFNSSLSTGVAVTGKAPYKAILSHGFTLDGQGRKMSKSIGNTIEPKTVVNQYGADILRLWVASVDYQSDVRVSDEILKQVAEVYRKIRNTFRFLLGNLDGYHHAEHAVAVESLNEVNRFMLVKLNHLVKKSLEAYDNYAFSDIYTAINNFCSVELSAFYLDYGKDIMYCDAENSQSRREIQTVLYECLTKMVRLVTPILPHTADEIWGYMSDVDVPSVQLTEMPTVQTLDGEDELVKKWDTFLEVRDNILKALEVARNEKTIGKSLNARLELYADRETFDLLDSLGTSLEQLFIVSKVEVSPIETAPESAMVFDGLSVVVLKAEGETCDRCWNIHEELSNDKLCSRCADVVDSL
ncbi:MAG: isoleucine-tRNA ligase [Bacillales bacterium]|jgi:isoleucyl-tRNA synthetase|nr:isoleucine-tRNA ligase [Bacillales bacterium]